MAKGFCLPIDDKFSLNIQTSMYWNCPLPQQHCGSFWVTARYQIQHRQKPCDAEASCGYVGAAGCEIIELDVICLNGEGCTLRLSGSILGITANPSPNIKKKGIAGKAATVSCTYVPADLFAAWSYVQGFPVSEEEFALEGVTRIEGLILAEYVPFLPKSVELLTFGGEVNQSLKGVALPNNLQSLTFGLEFNQRLERVALPSTLQSLTFGRDFNQSLEGVALPNNLQSLTFGFAFNQSLERVALPNNLQSLTFGSGFNRSLDRVRSPFNLKSISGGAVLVGRS